jgi:hypothetical protein
LLGLAKSTDLNPIGKIWNTLEQRAYSHKPITEAQLKRSIKKEWEEMAQEIVKNSILGTTKKPPVIVAAEGKYVESKRAFRP